MFYDLDFFFYRDDVSQSGTIDLRRRLSDSIISSFEKFWICSIRRDKWRNTKLLAEF